MEGFLGDLLVWEGSTFVTALFLGMVYGFAYDTIRIYRRIVVHKQVFHIFMQDVTYWIIVSIVTFNVTYELNNGIIRGFMAAGAIIGAYIYGKGIGRFYVKYMTILINFLLKPLKKIKNKTKMYVLRISDKIKKYIVAKKEKRHEV